MQLLHVRYVTEPGAGPDLSGGALLSDVLASPVGVLLGVGVAVGLALYGLIATRWPSWATFRFTLEGALGDYRHHIPWILRLATGIALMGSGVSAHLLLPHFAIAARGLVAVLLLAAGFALLVGVAVRFAAIAGLVLWGYAFGARGWDALMAAEIVAALMVLTTVSAGKPSLDDLIARAGPSAPRWVRPVAGLRWLLGPEPEPYMARALASWIPVALRIGLGVSLAYAGLAEKWLDPGPALATVARYDLAFGFVTPERWVFVVGLTEIILGLALVVGLAVRPFAALAFLVLTLTLFALPDDPVVAHVSLWGIASAVFILGAGPRAPQAVQVPGVPAV